MCLFFLLLLLSSPLLPPPPPPLSIILHIPGTKLQDLCVQGKCSAADPSSTFLCFDSVFSRREFLCVALTILELTL